MKKALITGASSGLGLEIGRQLKEKGFHVINLSRNKSEFDNLALDLSDDGSISKVTEEIKKNHSDFTLLILNSGIMPLAKVGGIDFDIDHLFRVNVTGSIKIINSLIELIRKNNADIVFTGSTASLYGYEEHSAYVATKHAIDGFIKSLKLELVKDNVRVIGFHPGGFNSNLRGGVIKEGYMDPKDLASLLINLLELPRSMEVSKIEINRNKGAI
ncbi:hypothetical protein CO038_00015 [Candidatus Pacearchaeota archaeon CG_4_9_14_0_2_um_filter_39_13]|nr:MAG: hypothetical protein CO038_00015 [Candidatus Pacearchaeota archaeon CG_4_9_14_0_2_um_filter_39_13]